MAKRTLGMVLIAALSLFVGISGLMGSAAMVSDGLGLSRFSTVGGAPNIGTTSAPPPDHAVNAPLVAFNVVRALLSLLLVAGGVGTLWVRPSARRFSLIFAVGWILLGIVEPWALHYMFGWPVAVSALYPFLLLFAFNSPSWRAAFSSRASSGEAAPPTPAA